MWHVIGGIFAALALVAVLAGILFLEYARRQVIRQIIANIKARGVTTVYLQAPNVTKITRHF